MGKRFLVRRVFCSRLEGLGIHFVRVNVGIDRRVCHSAGSFVRRSGRLTGRVIGSSRRVGDNRVRLRGRTLGLVTLRRPITDSFHAVIDILGTDSSLRHVNSRTIDVTGRAVLIGKGPHIPRVRRGVSTVATSVEGVLRRILSTCIGTSRGDTEGVTRRSGGVSRRCGIYHSLVIGRVRRRAGATITASDCLLITELLRQVNSRVIGLSR